MVNAYDDIAFTNEKCGMSALQAVNQVRGRDGVKMPALSETLSPAVFLKRLKNERRVELAFEGHRFSEYSSLERAGRLKRYLWSEDNEGRIRYKLYKAIVGYTFMEDDKLYFYPIANTELFQRMTN